MEAGSGGNSKAAARNMAIQRPGSASVHQITGINRAGIARTAFSRQSGATAMAAAKIPNPAANHQSLRRLEVSALIIARHRHFLKCVTTSVGPLFLVAHLQRKVQER